jgi:hypothetical protein
VIPKLTVVEYLGGYTLRIGFADGAEADVDLEAELWGEVFAPLRDHAVFQQVRLDTELNTLVWPTGADFAPEFLHACVMNRMEQATRR